MWRSRAVSRAVSALQPRAFAGLDTGSAILPVSSGSQPAVAQLAWAALHTAAASLQQAEAAAVSAKGPRDSLRLSTAGLQRRMLASAAEAAEEPSQEIIMTDAAVEQLRMLLHASTDGESILRLTVEAGGCSGFSYKFDLERGPRQDDRVFTYGGVRLVTDEISYEFVRGAKIDYVDELIKAAFEVVENPNASGNCGCGTSFSPKM